jgi:hypothetical protein
MRFILMALSLLASSQAHAADGRCDTPGVAQILIPGLFAENPSAQKLGLEVESVTMLSVDNDGCIVSVKTNRGYSFKYMFQLSPKGVATLDMISVAR